MTEALTAAAPAAAPTPAAARRDPDARPSPWGISHNEAMALVAFSRRATRYPPVVEWAFRR
jgi:hypothetical protein